MKKLFITLILAVMAIGVKAQVTWNVRAGAGYYLSQKEYFYSGEYYGSYRDSKNCIAPSIALGVNIPFSSISQFTLSPTLIGALGGGSAQLALPINVGYKCIIGDNCIFYPKAGPCIGADLGDGFGVFFGPSAELAFEINHFVIAADFYAGVINGFDNDAPLGVFATVGYKF